MDPSPKNLRSYTNGYSAHTTRLKTHHFGAKRCHTMPREKIGARETGESFLRHGRNLLIFQGNVRNLLIFQEFSRKWDKYMCSLLEVHTPGPTSSKYMSLAVGFTCQAVAVRGVLA